MSDGKIELRGVRVNNLQGVSLSIPRGELVVITGVSGSGKSSLAFDTLYAEGQRRYVQSLSAYSRQFLGKLPKPDADYIGGIPPAIVIEQRVSNRNARSTVGTSSEVYDYLRMLYARVGRIVSPVSGCEVKRDTVRDVVDFTLQHLGERVMLLAPLAAPTQQARSVLLDLLALEGYSRVVVEGEVRQIDSPESRGKLAKEKRPMELLIDRFAPTDDAEFLSRCGDSVEAAFRQGEGACRVVVLGADGSRRSRDFSTRLEADGLTFQPPTPALFSYNSPVGACPTCEGFGLTMGIDESLVVPDKMRSVFDNAVVCWKGPTMGTFREDFINNAVSLGFPIHRPYYQLTDDERAMLWHGIDGAVGIYGFFDMVASQKYKIQNRVLLSRYSGKTTCPSCKGKRLRAEATWVKVGGRSIVELIDMPLVRLADFFENLTLDAHDAAVASRLLLELRTRLSYLLDVGLGYLTLNRACNTLSGGETQRINLGTSLGSSLVGSLYILDEPSVGLHSVDTARLISVLKRLRDMGNTVLVVEHDEEIMRAADTIIDMGPEAGSNGGRLVCMGSVRRLMECQDSLTGGYLSGRLSMDVPTQRRPAKGFFEVQGIFVNNLRNVSVSLPLGVMTVVTGVSGSGKSSLVREGIIPALHATIGGGHPLNCHYSEARLSGGTLHEVEFVDQKLLTRSSRSTAVTYIKVFDHIRQLMASQPLARTLDLEASAFSFNAPGGRCEVCEGTGINVVEMQFMADIEVPCEACRGTRYSERVLEVQYRGCTIHDILSMTVRDAIAFFRNGQEEESVRIADRLGVLEEVGLGYIALGQGTSTFSGGEAQRLKLASYLAEPPSDRRMLFAFDEPTTGLHFHDVKRLMRAFNRLLERGHTLLIIEHNLDVIRLADWIVEMGPGAGEKGGCVVVAGQPEDVARCGESVTGSFLAQKLKA